MYPMMYVEKQQLKHSNVLPNLMDSSVSPSEVPRIFMYSTKITLVKEFTYMDQNLIRHVGLIDEIGNDNSQASAAWEGTQPNATATLSSQVSKPPE